KPRRKIPYISEVRALWPEIPIQMRALNNPAIRSIALSFERRIYKNANHIKAPSPRTQHGGTKHRPESKTCMIPNMAKVDEFWPREKNLDLIRQLGLSPSSFKVIHFGSLGLANGADYIIKAATLLKDNKDIEFIFIGRGSTEAVLKKMVADNGLENVHFLGRFPMSETSEIVNFCDASIVSFKDIPILYTNSPNKLFDSLS